MLLALGVALRGIAGPVPNGHFASIAAIGMAADNMWRWHTVLPIVGYFEQLPTSTPPTTCTTPSRCSGTSRCWARCSAFRDWVLRLPAVVYVIADPVPALSHRARAVGPDRGRPGAIAYVALPITIVYANYHDLEQPYIFGCVVASWGYVRFIHTWRDRYAVASALGFFFALNHAWWGYLWGAFFIPWIFVRGFLLPERWLGAVRARPFGRYCALMCGGMGRGAGVEVYLLKESGRLTDVLTSFIVRRGDHPVPLRAAAHLAPVPHRADVHGARHLDRQDRRPRARGARGAQAPRHRAASAGLPARRGRALRRLSSRGPRCTSSGRTRSPPISRWRWARWRRRVREAIAWLAARATSWSRRARRHGRMVAAAVLVGLPVAFVLRDGLSLVRLSRETGGRFAEANLESEIDKGVALRWFLARMPADASIGFHSGFPSYWELQWDARPRPIAASQSLPPASSGPRVYVLDSRAGLAGRSAGGRGALSRPRRRPVLVHRSAGAARAPRRLSLRRARAGLVGALVPGRRRARAHGPPRSVGHLGMADRPRADGASARRPAVDRRPAAHRPQHRAGGGRHRPARRACARRWPRVSTCRCGPGTRTAPS